jgi:predicted nucleic acid-binding protein
MGLVLLDSSVLIALINPADQHHSAAITSFDPHSILIASALSITEVLPRAISEGKEGIFWSHIGPYLQKVVDVDLEIASRAAKLRAELKLKTPDAIISATARAHSAQLWTFDAKLARATPGARLLA